MAAAATAYIPAATSNVGVNLQQLLPKVDLKAGIRGGHIRLLQSKSEDGQDKSGTAATQLVQLVVTSSGRMQVKMGEDTKRENTDTVTEEKGENQVNEEAGKEREEAYRETCTICGKVFVDQFSFNVHIKEHLKEKLNIRRNLRQKEEEEEESKRKSQEGSDEDEEVGERGAKRRRMSVAMSTPIAVPKNDPTKESDLLSLRSPPLPPPPPVPAAGSVCQPPAPPQRQCLPPPPGTTRISVVNLSLLPPDKVLEHVTSALTPAALAKLQQPLVLAPAQVLQQQQQQRRQLQRQMQKMQQSKPTAASVSSSSHSQVMASLAACKPVLPPPPPQSLTLPSPMMQHQEVQLQNAPSTLPPSLTPPPTQRRELNGTRFPAEPRRGDVMISDPRGLADDDGLSTANIDDSPPTAASTSSLISSSSSSYSSTQKSSSCADLSGDLANILDQIERDFVSPSSDVHHHSFPDSKALISAATGSDSGIEIDSDSETYNSGSNSNSNNGLLDSFPAADYNSFNRTPSTVETMTVTADLLGLECFTQHLSVCEEEADLDLEQLLRTPPFSSLADKPTTNIDYPLVGQQEANSRSNNGAEGELGMLPDVVVAANPRFYFTAPINNGFPTGQQQLVRNNCSLSSALVALNQSTVNVVSSTPLSLAGGPKVVWSGEQSASMRRQQPGKNAKDENSDYSQKTNDGKEKDGDVTGEDDSAATYVLVERRERQKGNINNHISKKQVGSTCCNICDREVSNRNLARHMAKHLSDGLGKATLVSISNFSGISSSDHASTTTTAAATAKRHMCNICGKTFSQRGHLNRHKKAQHRSGKDLEEDTTVKHRGGGGGSKEQVTSTARCGVCGKVCKSRVGLARHRLKHTTCRRCDVVFKTDKELERHHRDTCGKKKRNDNNDDERANEERKDDQQNSLLLGPPSSYDDQDVEGQDVVLSSSNSPSSSSAMSAPSSTASPSATSLGLESVDMDLGGGHSTLADIADASVFRFDYDYDQAGLGGGDQLYPEDLF